MLTLLSASTHTVVYLLTLKCGSLPSAAIISLIRVVALRISCKPIIRRRVTVCVQAASYAATNTS
jgi:hypothetical protein